LEGIICPEKSIAQNGIVCRPVIVHAVLMVYTVNMYEYKTSGTCSSMIRFDIKEGKIRSLSFDGGCDGNLKALGILLEGMDAAEAAKKLKGLICDGRKTSCADQLARAIEQYA